MHLKKNAPIVFEMPTQLVNKCLFKKNERHRKLQENQKTKKTIKNQRGDSANAQEVNIFLPFRNEQDNAAQIQVDRVSRTFPGYGYTLSSRPANRGGPAQSGASLAPFCFLFTVFFSFSVCGFCVLFFYFLFCFYLYILI